MNISVIGSGSWGTALTLLLCGNGHRVCLWSYREEESAILKKERENKALLPGVSFGDADITFTSDISFAANFGEILVSAVPSKAVAETARLLKIADGKTIVNVSKGIDEESLSRISEVFKDALPSSDIAVLSGPSHAEEVARKIPTTNVISCENPDKIKLLQDIFTSDNFRVYTNDDMIGVELGGALKNIIALGAGISDGMKFGDNAKAAIMTRGITEICRLGVSVGANVNTFSGLTGIGDLIVTCTSMHSRNRRCGIMIGEGVEPAKAIEDIGMVVEGITTAEAAYDMAQK